jgi:UDPglucose 6-dehydrogenase
MKIVVVGVGYVGLVSGACLADLGHQVACIDTDSDKIEGLKIGKIPIYEPGLSELVLTNSGAGRLSFSTEISDVMSGAGAAFIAVGTPSNPEDGHADLRHVWTAARDIARNLAGPLVIVTKSTVPVGTGDKIEAILNAEAPDGLVSVVSNPEFLREGSAIRDFQQPDRVIIGANDGFGREVMGRIYKALHMDARPIMYTDRRTSELIKYASNAFLATKIAFINEIANLCEAIGANVHDVSHGMGLDSRIGAKFLDAGPGYGGSCFPKDTLALVKAAREADTEMSIVDAVVTSNNKRKAEMASRVLAELGPDPAGKKVAVLGLTFKANTDDMRESPAIDVVKGLQAAGVRISAFDPAGYAEPGNIFDSVDFATDPFAACQDADAAVVVTEWGLFRNFDLVRLKATLRTPLLVDLRNIYDPAVVAAAGITYRSIGRKDQD